MSEKVKHILADLFMIDPELKKYEKEVEQAVINMMSAKPDTKFDESFAARLKAELALRAPNTAGKPLSFWQAYSGYLVGAGVFALFIVAAVSTTHKGLIQTLPGIVTTPKVIELEENAFGHLAFDNSTQPSGTPNPSQDLGSDAARSYQPMAGEAAPQNLSAPAPDTQVATGMGGGTAPSTSSGQTGSAGQAGISSKMIAPAFLPNYKLVYRGEEVKIEAKAKVYKRAKGGELASRVADALRGIDLGLFNIDALRNFRVRSLELVETGDRPYSFGINLEEGTAYINPDWQVWEEGGMPTGQGNSISDSEAIEIANQFLARYGVSRSNYGAPSVEQIGSIMYMKGLPAGPASPERERGEQAREPASTHNSGEETIPSSELSIRPDYYSPQVTVRYPLKVANLEVYDNGGTVSGLMVVVDANMKRVVSVNDITLPNYSSSVYTLETDFGRVKKLAEQGGIYGYYGGDPSTDGGRKTIILNLETPKRVLMRYWQYDVKGGGELIVPALYFEVTGAPTDQNPYYYYPKAVVVPLVKEIMDSIGQLPQPIPLEAPQPTQPTPTPKESADYPQAVTSAKRDLAAMLGVDSALIKVKSYDKTEWSDSCLGAGGPAELCAQVITPGYKIVLTYKDKDYEYHTDVDGSALRQVGSAL